ncbi:hypothetical protein IscW_ISCW023558 [Ixodes scapularis]|uniref:Uncharacterized protein n=1 Tax=Ixodes scapularis TaxID=6945 RepID=B7QHX9_IXOSC|nr:hypothetical protein IscW_ISCW023558 [Ixodes scapularis]|eukprot:XP_002414786.1 hypothetical protein IscW_ISCW023558 [Ixodes scapularis]
MKKPQPGGHRDRPEVDEIRRRRVVGKGGGGARPTTSAVRETNESINNDKNGEIKCTLKQPRNVVVGAECSTAFGTTGSFRGAPSPTTARTTTEGTQRERAQNVLHD